MTKELSYDEAIEKLTKIADSLNQKENELSPEMAEIVTALTKKHHKDPASDNWDDVWAMMDDIREHAKNNGRAVINEDRPHQLRFGWRCTNTNKTWSISLSHFKNSAGPNTEKGKILLASIVSQEGKQALTESLNSKV